MREYWPFVLPFPYIIYCRWIFAQIIFSPREKTLSPKEKFSLSGSIFRSSPWNAHSSPWNGRSEPWNVHSSLWNGNFLSQKIHFLLVVVFFLFRRTRQNISARLRNLLRSSGKGQVLLRGLTNEQSEGFISKI